MNKKFFLFALLVVLSLIVPSQVMAHDPSLSSIRLIYRPDDLLISVSTHISRLCKSQHIDLAEASSNEIQTALSERLKLTIDGKLREASATFSNIDNANDLANCQFVVKPTPQIFEVLAPIYPEDKTARTVVSVVRDGQASEEYLLDLQHPSFSNGKACSGKFELATQFIHEGVEHIFSGADHILFVLGLLLAGGGIRSLIAVITAFTIAHSVTLSLSALHILVLPVAFVEPAIAFSIIVIAFENIRKLRTKKVSASKVSLPCIAFCFGLVHGCGFASALNFVNLDPQQVLLSLISFNIGVEIGQALIILCIFPLFALLTRKKPDLAHRLAFVCSIAIGVIGAIWFVERL